MPSVISMAKQILRAAREIPDTYLPTEEIWNYRQFDPMEGPGGGQTLPTEKGWSGVWGPGDEDWGKLRLEHSLLSKGILHPITLTTDTDGEYAMLEDGHHRAALARQMGISHLPVKVQPVGMTGYNPTRTNIVGTGLQSYLQTT